MVFAVLSCLLLLLMLNMNFYFNYLNAKIDHCLNFICLWHSRSIKMSRGSLLTNFPIASLITKLSTITWKITFYFQIYVLYWKLNINYCDRKYLNCMKRSDVKGFYKFEKVRKVNLRYKKYKGDGRIFNKKQVTASVTNGDDEFFIWFRRPVNI